MHSHAYTALFAGAILTAPFAHAQLSLSSSGTYTQNFDTLPNTDTSAWVDNATLAGWYSNQTMLLGGNGCGPTSSSEPAGGLYSFGDTGSTERALGTIADGNTTPVTFGLVLENTSGADMLFGTLAFTGELWRSGTPKNTTETLSFSYAILPVGSTISASLLTSGSWTSIPAFDYVTPGDSPADGGALISTQGFSGSLNITVGDGEFLALRWNDIDDQGTDNGTGIDDLSLDYTVLQAPPVPPPGVPEPSTYGLLGVIALASLVAYRRRRS